jgi:hypothetical protein
MYSTNDAKNPVAIKYNFANSNNYLSALSTRTYCRFAIAVFECK